MKRRTDGSLIRWIVAVIYTAAIYAIAPLVPKLWDFLTHVLSNEGAIRTVNLAVPVLGAIAVVVILTVIRRRPVRTYFWLAAVVSGYAYLLTLHCEYPVERVHLIQYSLLAYVFHRAIVTRFSDRAGYIGALCAVAFVGLTDELLQSVLPNRSCTLADMVTNWMAGGLGLLGLIALDRDTIWEKVLRDRLN